MDWELIDKHLLSGFVPVFIILVLFFTVLRMRGKGQTFAHIIVSFVFCFYLVGVLTMTGIWYLGSYSPNIVYVPFADMIRGPVDTALNILLFVPLGVFLPLLFQEYDRIWKVALIGFLISLSIEFVQMFECGSTDINDLITNTVGACLGFLVYKLLLRVIPESRMIAVRLRGISAIFELLVFFVFSLVIMVTIQPVLFHTLFDSNLRNGEIHVWNSCVVRIVELM